MQQKELESCSYTHICRMMCLSYVTKLVKAHKFVDWANKRGPFVNQMREVHTNMLCQIDDKKIHLD